MDEVVGLVEMVAQTPSFQRKALSMVLNPMVRAFKEAVMVYVEAVFVSTLVVFHTRATLTTVHEVVVIKIPRS